VPDASQAATGPGTPGAGPRAPGWRWLVVALYMAGIFAASSLSQVRMPGRVSDKTLHGLAYAGLSALIVWALVRGDWRAVRLRTVAIAIVACAAYGVSDEIHQVFVPSRHADLRDLAADVIGASLGAGALWAWGIIARGSRQNDGP
jgi:VanZ family protein